MTIQKQGWLKKQGGFVKSWKKRWMVLYKTPEKQQISYYSDQGRTGLKGTIDLTKAQQVKAVQDNDKRFVIICSDRTWRLEALDHPERTSWIEAVRDVLGKKATSEEEVKSKTMQKDGSVMAPGKVSVPGEVPEKNTMQPGTQIQVVNGKVSDAGLDKRGPEASEAELKTGEDFDEVFTELCKLVDENGDDELNIKEFSEMYQEWAKNFFSDLFKKLDKDMSNSLSKSEFRQIFQLENGEMDTQRAQDTITQIEDLKFMKIFDEVCLIIDKNYDDKFDFLEFSAAYPEASQELFKDLDLNKDKFLSKEELKKYYRMDNKRLDTERVKKDYEKLEEAIYLQTVEKLCQMVNEDHEKQVIDIREFKTFYPAGTKVFIAAVGGIGDEESFQYDQIVKTFRDKDGWGDFVKVEQAMKDMKGAMFNTHFDGLCTLMDKDGDDTLNVEEFSMIYPVAAEFFFKELDENKDRKLQKSELRSMFVLANGSMDVERMAQIEADIKEKIDAKIAEDLAEKLRKEYVAPSGKDMERAKILYVTLKMDYTANPDVKSVDSLKWVLGEGGATQAWADLEGLRHKYFIYDHEKEVCSGVYVFYDQASLDKYMASDLFKQQSQYPHVSEVIASVKDVMPGTQACIEKTPWEHLPVTREDVCKARMLIVDITMNYETGVEGCPKSADELYPALAGGYTGLFANVEGLRGKYFAYDRKIDHCYGFYTFVDQESLDKYMASDLFKSQGDPPHIQELVYSVHEVLPGTERSMDLSQWKGFTEVDNEIDGFLDGDVQMSLQTSDAKEETKSPSSDEFAEFDEPKKAEEPAPAKTEAKKEPEPAKKEEPVKKEVQSQDEPEEDLEPPKKPAGCCVIS